MLRSDGGFCSTKYLLWDNFHQNTSVGWKLVGSGVARTERREKNWNRGVSTAAKQALNRSNYHSVDRCASSLVLQGKLPRTNTPHTCTFEAPMEFRNKDREQSLFIAALQDLPGEDIYGGMHDEHDEPLIRAMSHVVLGKDGLWKRIRHVSAGALHSIGNPAEFNSSCRRW